MAEMAPALTEAATQVRAKRLPKTVESSIVQPGGGAGGGVGGTAGLLQVISATPGRLDDCPSPSPIITDILIKGISPNQVEEGKPRVSEGEALVKKSPSLVATTSPTKFTKNLSGAVSGPILELDQTTSTATISVSGGVASVSANVPGTKRVAPTSVAAVAKKQITSTCLNTPASLQHSTVLQQANEAKAAAAKLSNLAASVRSSRAATVSEGPSHHLVASHNPQKNPHLQRNTLPSAANTGAALIRPSGSCVISNNIGTHIGTRKGELLLLKTVNRMNQATPKTLVGTQSSHSGSSSSGLKLIGGASGSSTAKGKMPHPAAAPNLQTSKSQQQASVMGYNNKTSTSTTPQQATNPPAAPQNAGSAVSRPPMGAGGVAPTAGSVSNPQASTSTGEPSTSLTNMDHELTPITLVEIQQSSSNSGMADVGLLNNVDRVAETVKRQRELERQADRLVRRLRHLQSRKTISHVQHQLSGFVDHQHKNLQTMAKAMKPQPNNSVDLKAELLQSEDVKSLSTAALVSLVRRLQSSQAMTLRQRLANSNQSGNEGTSVLRLDEDLCTEMNRVSSTLQKDLKHLESMLDSDATESSSGGESCDEDYDYDDDKAQKACLRRRAEWRWATERAAVAAKWTWLQAQVSDLEYRIRQQSDIYRQIRAAKGAVVLGEAATPEELLSRHFRGITSSATSSTGTTSTTTPRAGRRLSPLEEKIANLERKNEMSPCNLSTLLSNVDKQSSRLTRQLGNVMSPAESPVLTGNSTNKGASVSNGAATNAPPTTPPKTPKTPNGYLTQSGDTKTSRSSDAPVSLSFDPPSPAVDVTCQAARCRPVRSYGKRKLLTTSGLYQLSRKAARLSTVSCQCYPPGVPCAMCGGRYNNTQTVQPTIMPVGERVALLDHSYHQVLSFPQDTPLQIHFESLLRNGEWQHKPLPTKPLRPLGSTKGKQKGTGERKYRKNAASTLLSSAKIRSKYEMKQLATGAHGPESSTSISKSEMATAATSHGGYNKTPETKMRKRKASLSSSAGEGGRKKRNSMSGSGPPAQSPTTVSPRDTPSPLSHSCPTSSLRDMKDAGQRRRRGESAFDINNIVIPYSMAASTRVEKLLYKEIITPKWRKIGQEAASRVGPEQETAPSLPTPTQTPDRDHTEPLTTTSKPHSSSSSSSSSSTMFTSTPLPPTPITPSNPLLQAASPSTNTGQETDQPAPASLPDTPVTPETLSSNPPMASTYTPSQETVTAEVPVRKDGTGEMGESTVVDKRSEQETGIAKPNKPMFKLVVEPAKCSTSGENGRILADDSMVEDDVTEDLTDETIAARHMRCEVKEKKRFMSVIKKRSRSNTRTDSISAPDDVTLPPDTDIVTPAAATTTSAASTPPGTPAPTMAPPPQLTALIDEELELAGGERRRSGSCSSHEDLNVGGRRRSLSGRLRSRALSSSFNSVDDQEDGLRRVEPWAARTFPLTEAEFDKLVKESRSSSNGSHGGSMTAAGSPDQIKTASGRPMRQAATTTKGGYTYHTATPDNSNPTSPIPSSSNSSVLDDDPNDPEWTVVDGVDKPALTQSGLVLKLAKR